MLRLIMRGAGIIAIHIFLLVPAGFSKNPAKKTKKELKEDRRHDVCNLFGRDCLFRSCKGR